MPTYVVNPADPTTPTDTQGATQGAEELRAIKAYIAGLAGLTSGMNVLRKNAIIGGNFDTNPWQRGTNFVGIADGAASADRWKYIKVATTLVEDITKAASAPTIVQAGVLISNCLQVNVTTAEAAIAAGEINFIYQNIEGYNFAPLAQKPIVLSFWHAHTKIGTYCIALGNAGADRTYIAEYTQLVADTWEYVSIIIPASPAAGTWNYINGIGLQVNFTKYCGATYQTAANAWVAGQFLGTANQVNSCDTIGNKFRIANVQVEAGGAATPFENTRIQEVLALCQRYYEKSFNQGTTPVQNAGFNSGELGGLASKAAAGQNYILGKFNIPKRISNPNFITYSPAAATAQAYDETILGACTGTAAFAFSDTTFGIGAIGNAGTTVGNLLTVHWTADAEL